MMTQEQPTNKFWDKEELISEFPMGQHSKMRVMAVQKKDKTYIAYREFYNSQKDPNWKPSKHGGAIQLEFVQFFIEALKSATITAQELGWD